MGRFSMHELLGQGTNAILKQMKKETANAVSFSM